MELNSLQEKQIKEVYKSKIKDSVGQYIFEATGYIIEDMIVDIYEDKPNYGAIRGLDIILKGDFDAKKPYNDSITIVKIEDIRIGEESEMTLGLEPFKNSEELISVISKNYDVPKGNIRIFIKTLKGDE